MILKTKAKLKSIVLGAKIPFLVQKRHSIGYKLARKSMHIGRQKHAYRQFNPCE